MFRYIGKNDAKIIIIIFVFSPIPNHNIKSGIRERGGTFLKNWMSQSKYLSKDLKINDAIERKKARKKAIK